ncbi:MAG: LPS export ABC transporter periplasmic protein LptC [Pseudomonadota bacterium]
MSEAVVSKSRLDNLPSAPRVTGAEAAAHSRQVRRLRIILPSLAVVLVCIFFANTRNDRPEDVFLDQLTNIEAMSEELRMANPHFSGVDADGTPFDITASSATQISTDNKTVELNQPKAVSGTDGGEQSTISAKTGKFNSDENMLELTEDVVFERRLGSDSYVMRTSSATFNVDQDTVESNVGVEGDGPRGSRIKADRMTANNETQKAVFEGNVAVRIYPKREEEANKGAAKGEARFPSVLPGTATTETEVADETPPPSEREQ